MGPAARGETLSRERDSSISTVPDNHNGRCSQPTGNVHKSMDRRKFLSTAGILVATKSLDRILPAQTKGAPAKQGAAKQGGKADYSLRIEPCNLEIGQGVTVKTLAYNGQVPGRCCACAKACRSPST